MQKVAVAMSGGVDSSVAAMMLREQGYEVLGVTFTLNDISTAPQIDARAVCDFLGIEHRIVDYRKDFENLVIQPFLEEYRTAKTPNPCVACNQGIKFGRFLEDALAMGCDLISTGHYANVLCKDGVYLLEKADDVAKDQTYALYCLKQHQLSRLILPLSGLKKSQIRAYAAEKGLPVAHRPDSQDICFIPDGDYGAFIEKNMDTKRLLGNFIDKSGKILGKHKGIHQYTVGQRKGLGLSLGKPSFVLSIDEAGKNITITTDEQDLFAHELLAKDISLANGETFEGERDVMAKIRYAHKECPAKIRMDGKTVHVRFTEAQRAITAGQSVVFYVDGTVLGGGIIKK